MHLRNIFVIDSPFKYISNAYGKNHYDIDLPFKTILRFFKFEEDLSSLGKFVGNELYEITDYVDKFARPKLIYWTLDGERLDRAWIDPAQRIALEKLIKEFKIIEKPFKDGDWLYYFASIYLIGDPGISCIITVTNQTAFAIYKYGNEELKNFLPSLIGEKEELKFGATWFTEIQGGSDLGSNLVQASYKNGKWFINGNTKYFASNAGLANFALVTARPQGSKEGAKGLALFLVPEINSFGKKNFLIRRLKDKSGTISVPTGEVEFNNSEAWLIGEAEKGIYYTLENLMISRLSNAVGALGIARKAYLESYYYAKKRSAFGKKLIQHPLILRDLIEMESYIEGTMALTFKAIDLFQKSYMDNYPYSENYHYARLLTHISKNLTADMASQVTKMAMELHGGIGFLTEFVVERWHREALITPIWEGTSNIQALDMLEVIQKKNAHITMLEDIDFHLEKINIGKEIANESREEIVLALDSLRRMNEEEAQFNAKNILNRIGHAYSTLMLLTIGNSLNSERMIDVAKAYWEIFVKKGALGSWAIDKARSIIDIDVEIS